MTQKKEHTLSIVVVLTLVASFPLGRVRLCLMSAPLPGLRTALVLAFVFSLNTFISNPDESAVLPRSLSGAGEALSSFLSSFLFILREVEFLLLFPVS